MYEIGDLVVIAGICDIAYFKGSTAIVIKYMGHDATDTSFGSYYQLQFSDGSTHIFTQQELILLSRVERKNNNENR